MLFWGIQTIYQRRLLFLVLLSLSYSFLSTSIDQILNISKSPTFNRGCRSLISVTKRPDLFKIVFKDCLNSG